MATPANKQCGSSSLSSVSVLDAVNSNDSEDVSDYDSDSNGEHSGILGGLRNVKNNNRKVNSPPMLGLAMLLEVKVVALQMQLVYWRF